MSIDTFVESIAERLSRMNDSTRHAYYSAAALFATQPIDVITTGICVKRPSLEEANMVPLFLMDKFGPWAGQLLWKGVSLGIAFGLGSLIHKEAQETRPWLLRNIVPVLFYGSTAYCAYICANNIYHLLS